MDNHSTNYKIDNKDVKRGVANSATPLL